MSTMDLNQRHLPLPGEWLGLLCDALAIKTVMNDKIRNGHPLLSTKMLQRYFRGEFIQSREHIDAIHKLFVDTISSKHPGVLGIRKEFLLMLLEELESVWLELIKDLKEQGQWHWTLPVKLTVARYLIPDLAIRVAVWLRLYTQNLSEEYAKVFQPISLRFMRIRADYFSAGALGACLEICRDEQGYDSWNSFAMAHDLDPQKLDQWRKGIHLPDHNGIDELSRIITNQEYDDECYMRLYDYHATQLRLWRGVSYFFKHLKQVCGEARTRDLTELFRHIFYAIHVCLPYHLGHPFEIDRTPDMSDDVKGRLNLILYRGLKSVRYAEIQLDLKRALLELKQLISSGMIPEIDMSWHGTFFEEFEIDLICFTDPDKRARRLAYWVPICAGASEWSAQFYPCFTQEHTSTQQDTPAFEECDEATQRQIIMNLCHTLESLGDYEKALEIFRAESKSWEYSSNDFAYLGYLIIRHIEARGRYTLAMYYEAMDHIHHAMLMEPDATDLSLLMLRLLDLATNHERTLVYVDEFLKRGGEKSRAHLLRAYPLMALGRLHEASRCLEGALKYERYARSTTIMKDLACLCTVLEYNQRARQLGLKLEKLRVDNPYKQGVAWSKKELEKGYLVTWS